MRLILCTLLGLCLSACATRGALGFDCEGWSRDHLVRHNEETQLEEAINMGSGKVSSVMPVYVKTIPVPSMMGAVPAQSTPAINKDELSTALLHTLEATRPNLALSPAGAREPTGILMLSGGGQWGAYSAAFLRTLWLQGRLPDFPVISGVSTGALQSLFVATNHYNRMVYRYDPRKESDIVDRNWAPLTLVTGSMAGLKPLKKLVEIELCEHPDRRNERCMMDDLADLAKNRRHVFIGFVHAKDGQFQYVDVVDIANDTNMSRLQRRQCIVGAALASAAMPVNFQQVQINQETYYDGGVRLSVFEGDIVRRAFDAAAAFTASSTPDATGSRTLPAAVWRIYVVRNGRTVVQDFEENPDKSHGFLAAAMRADNIVTNQLEVESIAALRLQYPDLPIFMTSANGIPCVRPQGQMFNPAFMRCLQCLGYNRASVADPWNPLPALGAAYKPKELPTDTCQEGSKAPWQDDAHSPPTDAPVAKMN